MSMDDFMRSLSDQQKAMFLKALQDSGTPPESNNEDETKWTTTMPPHIKEEMEPEANSGHEFAMNKPRKRKQPVRATGKNLFMDDGAECVGEENVTPEYKPTQRRRRPAETVTVSCSVCGKSMKLQKQFVHGEYHRCERCVGR